MKAFQSAGFAYQPGGAYQDTEGFIPTVIKAFQTSMFAYQGSGQFAYQDTEGVAPTTIVDWIVRARRHCIR